MFKSLLSLALVASAAAFAPASPAFVSRSAAVATNSALFMSAELEEKVKNIIVEQLGVEADKVVPEASFIDDLGADSLDTVELIMAIEEEFDTEIPEEEAAAIATVKDAIDFVSKL
jgi:acyl carrier protein